MAQKFSNAAKAELLDAIHSSSVELWIVEGEYLFPELEPDDWMKLVLQYQDDYEIVYCRHRNGEWFRDLERGQEGTEARSWPAGTVVALRPTAGDMEDAVRKSEGGVMLKAETWMASRGYNYLSINTLNIIQTEDQLNFYLPFLSDVKAGDRIVIQNNGQVFGTRAITVFPDTWEYIMTKEGRINRDTGLVFDTNDASQVEFIAVINYEQSYWVLNLKQ